MALKPKLLFLSLILLLTQGTVLASVTSITPASEKIQSGSTLTINATATQTTDNLYIILDNNSNGNYDSSSDLLIRGSVTSASVSQEIGDFAGENTSSITEGTYTIYGVQQSNEPADGETVTGQASAQITFDNTPPSITNFNADIANFYSGNISFISNEELDVLTVGRNTSMATDPLDEFSKNSSSGSILYWSVIEVNEEGEIEFEFLNAEDAASNLISESKTDTIELFPIVDKLEISENSGFVQVEISTFDQLNTINVSLIGSSSNYLDYENFTETYDSQNDKYNYTANLSQNDGYFNATLLEATNSTGHDGAWEQTDEQSFQIPPTIERFYLTTSNQDVKLHLDTNEKLSMIDASYDGTVSSGGLDYSKFTETQDSGYYNYTVDIPSGQEGIYNATLDFVEDDSGNRNSTELTDEIVVDSTPPEINDYQVSSNQEIINVSFESNEKVETIDVSASGAESFNLDDNDFSNNASEAPYVYWSTYDATNEGDVTVTLNEASDISGNDGSSVGDSLTTTVQFPPTIHEFDLFADSLDVNLKINSSEQLQTLDVDLTDDVSQNLGLSDFTESSTNSYYIYETNVSEGTEGEFGADLLSAVDSQGLDGSDGESDFLLLDTSPPPNPVNTTIVDTPITSNNQGSITVRVNFSSTTETGELDVRFDSSNGSSVTKTKSVTTTDQLQFFDFDLSDVADGDIEAESRMTDEAGNLNSEGFTANSSNVTKDTTPPTIENVITGDSLSGESTARDVLTVEFSDNIVGLSISSVSEGDFTITSNGQGINIDSLIIDSGIVTINLAEELHTGATPTVDIVDIGDNYGNSIDTTEQRISSDGLKPQILSA